MLEKTIEKLNWRYATKQFDKNKKLSEEQINELKEVVRLAPSSLGLQPWKVLDIRDPKVRAQIQEKAWGQAQIVDASHLFVFCTRLDVNKEYVNNFVELVAKERNQDLESLESYKGMLLGSIEGKTKGQLKATNETQAFIALGQLLTACAMNGIDACPMGGFDKEGVNEVLGLKKKKLTVSVICALGYRDEKDSAIGRKKVRFGTNELFTVV